MKLHPLAVAFLVLALPVSSSSAPVRVASPSSGLSPDTRIAGVRILVSDMNAAIEFYTSVVGFGIRSMDDYPDHVTLENDGLDLHLAASERPAQAEYAETVRTTFGFQANDLMATRERMERAGVKFIEPEPERVGIGIATTFHDPFGNVLYLLEQQVGEFEPFDEPRIYNVGYHIRDVTAGRRFYCDLLGFVVRTERYFPAIPLGHADGSFAFMLHEKTDLRPHAATYPKDSQVVIQFETDNLDRVVKLLREAGAAILKDVAAKRDRDRMVAVRDPFGNVFELREWTVESSQ